MPTHHLYSQRRHFPLVITISILCEGIKSMIGHLNKLKDKLISITWSSAKGSMIESTSFQPRLSWDDFTSSRSENFPLETPINILIVENVSYVKVLQHSRKPISEWLQNMQMLTKMSNAKRLANKWELLYCIKSRKIH